MDLDTKKLLQVHEKTNGPPRPWKKARKNPLEGKPYAKGVVLRTLIKKPKKPNSANRKCVLVRLSIGKELIAYVPGMNFFVFCNNFLVFIMVVKI